MACTLAFVLISGTASAANPPDAEMAAAAVAMADAERASPRGDAADVLGLSRERFDMAQKAVARKKYRDAISLADEAHALADLALAKAQLANARASFEEKSARNAELRRQLLVLPGSQP